MMEKNYSPKTVEFCKWFLDKKRSRRPKITDVYEEILDFCKDLFGIEKGEKETKILKVIEIKN